MSEPLIYSKVTPRQVEIIKSVRINAETLLNCSPRFRLFTLHGTPHITNLFTIADFLIRGGITLSSEEAFLLSLSLCVHDLGMVVGLKDLEVKQLLQGNPAAPDPSVVENEIRDSHHLMVDKYIDHNINFLVSLGVSPTEIAHVSAISKCHRKIVLHKEYGLNKYLGALLRVIDELDVGNERAPLTILNNIYNEMDSTSLWHWVKHNIVENWIQDHTVIYKQERNRQGIQFKLIVHPSNLQSAQYWLYQIKRPIYKALVDDGCAQIISEKFGVHIEVATSIPHSTPSVLGQSWKEIEEKALTGGGKVVILIDDEVRKMGDLMLPISFFAHVLYGFDATDTFSKLAATPVQLAIVDMQISGYGIWTAEETHDYKMTGLNIIHKIKAEYPNVKIGVLTGTRYDISELNGLGLAFILRKPCDPATFVQKVKNALQ